MNPEIPTLKYSPQKVLVHFTPGNKSAIAVYYEERQLALMHGTFDEVIVGARETSQRLDVPIVIVNTTALVESIKAHRSA
jgi:hypothetical protein